MNHYERLGVSRNATHAEIRTAYRALARRLHPDRLTGIAESEKINSTDMHSVNAAWHVLSDPARRAAYDRSLRPPSAAPPRPTPPRPVVDDLDEPFDPDVDPAVVRRWYLLIVATSIGAVVLISVMMIYAFMRSGG